jgi:hypothetical protein
MSGFIEELIAKYTRYVEQAQFLDKRRCGAATADKKPAGCAG